MASTHITKTTLADPMLLADGQTKRRLFDSKTRGFIAEVRRACTTFYFRYRDGRGRAREVKLGRLGDVTLEQARKRAEQLKAETSLGGDPVADSERKRAIPTVASFVSERYLPHVRERLRSAGNVDAYCRRIVPALGAKALDEVTATDVAAFRRRLMAASLSNASVNRHLATLRSLFNLARKWGLYEGANPAASPGMLAERHRDVYLSAGETQALVRALDAEANREAAAALMLLIVTGARKNEVLKARWEHVDLERRLLTVPRSKSGKTRHIALSSLAARVLVAQLQRQRPQDGGFVFPGKNPGRPLENVRCAWARAKKAAGLRPDTRIHDLRHSFASALANNGVPLNEIGVLLGHSQLSTTARYAHHAPQRLVETATVAARAWNLLPATVE